jgi:hypothetical protein
LSHSASPCTASNGSKKRMAKWPPPLQSAKGSECTSTFPDMVRSILASKFLMAGTYLLCSQLCSQGIVWHQERNNIIGLQAH